MDTVRNLNPESLVPFLPDIIRMVRDNLKFPTFPWPQEKMKQVKDFFAIFAYPSAVPHLLNALKNPDMTLMDEVIGEPQITTEKRLDGWDDEGTFGWSKGQKKLTLQVVTRAYRLRDPVAEGAKAALREIKQECPSLVEEIEQAIRDFDNIPPQTSSQREEQILDSEILWEKSGSWK